MEDQGFEVVDPLDWAAIKNPAVVAVGVVARVTQKGFTEEYLVAGAKDTHLATDAALVPVPYTSPLGQALMGRAASTRLEAEIAGERRTLVIESLRAPTRPEIAALYPELTLEAQG